MEFAKFENGQPIFLLDKDRARTHTHIIGASGVGKSKLLEHMVRQDMDHGNGLCVIDWHGTLYHNVLAHAVNTKPPRPIILLDLSKPEYLLGFNPFSPRGGDISTQVENRISATIKPWGMENTDQTPRIEAVARTLYHFLVEADESLYNASSLLQFKNIESREYARQVVRTSTARDLWEDLKIVNTASRWQDRTESTKNRLQRFVAQESIKISTSLRPVTLDIPEVLRKKAILLVNLAVSPNLSMEAARVYAALLLNEFFEAGMARASDPPPPTYYLYLDEFQEYTTTDMGNMLDQARKGGLHLVMAHQRMGHLYKQPDLLDAVLTNAKIRIVFGGLRYPAAAELAQEMMLHRINERQIIESYYHLETKWSEDSREVHTYSDTSGNSSSSGRSSGKVSGSMSSDANGMTGELDTFSQVSSSSESDVDGEFSSGSISSSKTHSVTTQHVLRPNQTSTLSGRETRSREEKVSMQAELLMAQEPRFCVVKFFNQSPQLGEVPWVNKINIAPEVMDSFIKRTNKDNGAIAFEEAQRRVEQARLQFSDRVKTFLAALPPPPEKAKRTFRTKKRPAKS